MARPRATKRTPKRKSPRCATCGAAIHVPEGWSDLPAIRRHYWRKHREVMQPGWKADR